jgi:hypothetical protein
MVYFVRCVLCSLMCFVWCVLCRKRFVSCGVYCVVFGGYNEVSGPPTSGLFAQIISTNCVCVVCLSIIRHNFSTQ